MKRAGPLEGVLRYCGKSAASAAHVELSEPQHPNDTETLTTNAPGKVHGSIDERRKYCESLEFSFSGTLPTEPKPNVPEPTPQPPRCY